ncbi:hypothetical protein LJK87_11265 [Paenibacillus sp. P25]|nr:hypothetical protein LJK87_11265 [Paenibacillus sp. P25]
MTDNKEVYNETSNTAAGINTPPDQEDCTATDMISEAVEQMMDEIQHTFIGDDEKKR